MSTKSIYSVPDTSLQRLRCSLCYDYLSQFPVHICKEIGSVCGRCPVLHDENPVRNEAYEIIASNISFPCRYTVLGCLEMLTPKNLVEHEETCTFRQYFCPFMPSGCCPWQGPSCELMAHYQEKHTIFILEDSCFEIDFTSKYSENYLLCDKLHLFVVHKKSDVNENLFWCSVSYIGARSISEQYNFKLILSVQGNEERTYELPTMPIQCFSNPNIDKSKAVEIEADLIMKEFNNPASVTCSIVIIEKQKLDDKTNEKNLSAKRIISVDSIEEEILSDLECPVCLEFMVPPIYQCEVGHSICSVCKTKINECPSCKQSIRETRNFHLERITNRIKYHCKYRDYECSFISSAQDIKQHESECKYGPYKCPLHDYPSCNWNGKLSDVMEHMRHTHHDNVLEFDTITVPFDDDATEDDDVFVIQAVGELFKLVYKCEDQWFYWAVQLIGPAAEANKFMFILDIIDNTNKSQRLFLKRHCSPLTLNNVVFSEDMDFVKIPLELIECMIDNSLSYRVQITPA